MKELSTIESELHQLRMAIRQKIINILKCRDTSIIELQVDELDDPTYVYWTNGKGEVYEAPVIAVLLAGETLSFKLDLEESIVIISEEDGDIAMRCHEWLIDIIYNICQILDIEPETI